MPLPAVLCVGWAGAGLAFLNGWTFSSKLQTPEYDTGYYPTQYFNNAGQNNPQDDSKLIPSEYGRQKLLQGKTLR